MHKSKLGAVHSKNFFFWPNFGMWVLTIAIVQGGGEGCFETDTIAKKTTIFHGVFPAKQNFK